MTNKELKSSKTRRPYQKPQINQVKLVPEEAVLGGCKAATGATASGNSSGCISPNSCVASGT